MLSRVSNTIRTVGTLVPIGLALLLLASAVAYAETGKRPSPESVKRGETLYGTFCQACHREKGVGEPVAPWGIRRPDFVEAMPLNETSHAWHHSDEQLMVMILDGTPRSKRRMPVWRGTLSEAQVSDLIAYMKSLWSDRILACQGPKHMSCM